jgi:hypothetical protein
MTEVLDDFRNREDHIVMFQLLSRPCFYLDKMKKHKRERFARLQIFEGEVGCNNRYAPSVSKS